MLQGLVTARKVGALTAAAFLCQAGIALAIDGVKYNSPKDSKREVVYLPQDLFESEAYLDFTLENGAPLQFGWNLDNGTVRRFVGSIPLVSPSEKGDPSEIESAVRSFIDRHSALFGATSDSFTFGAKGYVIQPRHVAYVWMEQLYKGVPVHGAGVSFSIHTPSGNLMKFFTHDVVADPDVDVTPFITSDDAANRALLHARTFPGFRFVQPESDPRLQVLSTRNGTGRAAYTVTVRSGFPEEPGRWYVHVDAQTGAILRVDDLVREIDVTGNVKVNAQIFDPTSAVTPLNIADMQVRIVGGATVYTDANGNFTIPNAGASAVNVEAKLLGRWVNVQNVAGAEEILTLNVTPPGPANFVFNLSNTEQTRAQSNSAYHQNLVHSFISGRVGPSGLDTAFTNNVNLASTCNAYYDGVSTNYFLSGGGCNNTAFDTVVHHEYGHWADDVFGGILDGGLSEGIGDVMGLFITNQPILGENFFTSGGFIRDGNNTVTWPGAACGGEVHCLGEIWMGYAWRARVNLIASLGAAAGAEAANVCFVDTLPANSNSIPDAVTDSFIADDDDGNLANGTPNYADLAAAAEAKNLPYPEVQIVSLTHTALGDTRNTATNYVALANATSTEAAISSVVLTYRVNGGADTQVNMAAQGGGNYRGEIPAQFCNTVVEYYIRATDANGNTKTSPSTAPGTRYRFTVGDLVQVYFNNFDGGTDEGWTHVLVATQDDWHRKNPNPFGSQAYDPPQAFSGANCWGNDLQPTSGWNGDYANSVSNYLQSPVINTAGFSSLTLSYRRWLTVEDGFYDTARVLINGAQVWRNPVGAGADHFIDTAWTEHQISFTPAATTQVRFELVSDAGLTFGGWNVDDFRLFALSCVATLEWSDLTPSIGQNVTIDIGAGPNEDYYMLMARNLGAATYTPAGGPVIVTGLAAPIRAKRTGVLDPSGNVSISANVPNRPSLVGRTLHFQAVDGGGRKSPTRTVTVQP